MKTLNFNYSNIYDLIEVLKAISDIEMKQKYIDFAGEKNEGDIYKKLINGCPYMFSRFTAAAHAAVPETYNHPVYEMANQGLFFDVATYLTGVPECWLNEAITAEIVPAKDIYINIAAPFWVSETDIFAKLIKVLAYIDSLEQSGQRLNIYCCLSVLPHKVKTASANFSICIKKENDPLNLAQMCYLMASPVLLRFAFLALYHNAGYKNNTFSDLNAEICELKKDSNYYIPSISFDAKNEICKVGKQNFNYSKFDCENAYKHF